MLTNKHKGDNARVHIAKHVLNIAEFCGIKIIPLPPRCPEYNFIEYSWKDNKRETAKLPIK
ncbi:MAG: transposase [Methanobacteriaceae archaeon]|nr:transposase [Methanobacteriaceae archaeon]